jgi:hypothetical protein
MTEASDVVLTVNMATLEVFQVTGVSYKLNVDSQNGYVKHV